MAESDPSLRVPPLPRLGAAVARGGVVGPARLALRQYLVDYDRDLAGAFRGGAPATGIARARAAAVQRVLGYAWLAWLGDTPDAALVATGGFGRGELFPYSDVDLLVLTAEHVDARVLRAIESFNACLWDLGLQPGHAVRDVADCRALAAEDVGVYTNLLEARCIEGSRALADALLARLPDESLWTPAKFLVAKQAEQDARHLRFGDTAYNLEPHLKEGPGGLRDLQTIGWLGRALAGSADAATMVEAGMLDAGEIDVLDTARSSLFRVRYALHLLARRAENACCSIPARLHSHSAIATITPTISASNSACRITTELRAAWPASTKSCLLAVPRCSRHPVRLHSRCPGVSSAGPIVSTSSTRAACANNPSR